MKTKVVCTVGPACENILHDMIRAGMDCARINISHGTLKDYARWIDLIRKEDIPVMFDTKGSEVRIFSNRDIQAIPGEKIELGLDKTSDTFLDYNLLPDVKVGQRMFFDDGFIKSRIIEKKRDSIIIEFDTSGTIRNAKRLNLPDSKLRLPCLHQKDIEALKIATRKKIDFIALSFTRSKEDVLHLRRRLSGTKIGIIAKLENGEGIENLDEILKVVDGVMVARGDLGVELPSERIPLIQKEVIRKCNVHGRFVITATQMLQSMIDSPVPTRAETSDVANAILDGTDAIMLSAESAIGKYPIESVREMVKIAEEAEKKVHLEIPLPRVMDITEAISHSLHNLHHILPISKVIVLSNSGYTARMITRFRIPHDIITITPRSEVRRKLELHYGVLPVLYKRLPQRDKVLHGALFAFRKGLVKEDDTVLFTAGLYSTQVTNLIEIHKIRDLLDYAKKEKIL